MTRWSITLVVALVFGALLGLGYLAAGSLLLGQTKPVPAQAVPAAPKEPTSYRGIVKQVLPAVVSIETKAKTPARKKPAQRRPPAFDDPSIPEELRSSSKRCRS